MRTPVRQVFRRVEKHRREIRVRGRSRINKNDRAMCRYRNDVSRNTITVVWHQRQKLYRCPRQHGARARSVQSALVTGNVDFAFSIRMNLTKKVHLVIIIYDLFQITTQLNYDLLRTLKFINVIISRYLVSFLTENQLALRIQKYFKYTISERNRCD